MHSTILIIQSYGWMVFNITLTSISDKRNLVKDVCLLFCYNLVYLATTPNIFEELAVYLLIILVGTNFGQNIEQIKETSTCLLSSDSHISFQNLSFNHNTNRLPCHPKMIKALTLIIIHHSYKLTRSKVYYI